MEKSYSEKENNGLPLGYQDLPSSSGITLMNITLAILKRPWIVAICLLLVMIPIIYTVNRSKPVYRSSAMVMVSVEGTSFNNMFSLYGRGISNAKPEKYYTSILDSRAYREDVTNQVINYYSNTRKDSMRNVINIGYSRSPREEGFITIYGLSQSKGFALFLAQASLEQFKNRCIDLERAESQQIVRFIDDQLSDIYSKISKAEENLQDFLRNKNLLIEDTKMGVGKQLFDLEKNLTDAEANSELIKIQIASYNTQVKQMMDQITRESPKTDDRQITQLKTRLRDIQAKLENQSSLSAEEIQNLQNERNSIRNQLLPLLSASSSNMENQYQGITLQKLEQEMEVALLEQKKYENQVDFYKVQIDRFTQQHPNLSKDILEYASLTRAKEILQKTLDILLEKREEANIRYASEQGGIKVIDEPSFPNSPLPQNKTSKLLLGFMFALGLGIVLSVIIDKFDTTIKDETDVIRYLGITVFGTIPALIQRKKRSIIRGLRPAEKLSNPGSGMHLLTDYSEKSSVAEAYRSLKTSLFFLATDRKKKVFVISSPGPAEGKSLTTINTAISFAQGGLKTLVIDGDLRRPVQHKYFKFNRTPGLTNYLYGEVTLNEVIHETPIRNLYLITSGQSPPNPAEMVASYKMQEFIQTIRPQFDIIIIDSPPMLACVDSRVTAKNADGIILIGKVESTNIKVLEHSIYLAKRLNVEVLGVILNQTETRYGNAYYYVYHYYNPYSYYSSYSYYYQYSETGERIKKKRSGTKETKTNPNKGE